MHTKIVRDIERDAALEKWLRTIGVARYDAYHREPKGYSAAKVFASLRRYHHQKLKNKPARGA